jgi:hypothetical protein|tara:strand:- start:1834 stop:2091 length:258 start_codon:yes stop_codon:yes gene_type:complete
MNLKEKERILALLAETGLIDEFYEAMVHSGTTDSVYGSEVITAVDKYLDAIAADKVFLHGFVWNGTQSGHHAWHTLNTLWKGTLR